ncbi:MAG: hypothetical protein UT66_C0036G0020 [candidate division CPR2 bacterium GW2011_GWC1_39_9]|nr:MAG: hypothetical protein UT66_C0036G0020 [candidate division CPR2 bacterium GW2011_GWC1_39_9]
MKRFVFSLVFLLLLFIPANNVGAVSTESDLQLSKTTAKADGEDEIIVNVLPCYTEPMDPSKITVTLNVPSSVTSTPQGTVSGTVCGDFRVNFSISSSTVGQVSVSANISGVGYDGLVALTAQKVTFEAIEVPTPTPTATPEPTPTPTARPTTTPIEVESLDKPEFTSFDVDGQDYDPEDFAKLTLKNDAKITVSGKSIANGKVTIFLNPEHQKGTAKADATGLWEYMFEEKMDGGDHSIEAKVADGEGNASKWARIEFKVEESSESAATVQNGKYGKNPAVWVILVLFLITVSGLGIFFYRRKKKPKESDQNGFGQDQEDAAMSSGIGKKSYVIKEDDGDADFDRYVPEEKTTEEADEDEEESGNADDEDDNSEESEGTEEAVEGEDSSNGEAVPAEGTEQTDESDVEEEPVDMFDEKKFEKSEPNEETGEELPDEVFAADTNENFASEKTLVIEESLSKVPKETESKKASEAKESIEKKAKPKKSSKKKK